MTWTSDNISKLMTDVGNAQRFVTRHGDRFRYCDALGGWLVWDGKRWSPDEEGKVITACKDTTLAMIDEANGIRDDLGDILSNWARKSQSKSRLTAMEKLARPELAVTLDQLDADPWLLNCVNGTVDLRTGDLRPHVPTNFITRMAPVAYDPKAQCPRFDAFLARVFAGDKVLIGFAQQFLGHCLTGDITEQYLVVFHGDGANGKSVLIDTVCGVMGDYAGEAPPFLITSRRFDEHPTEIADLRGKRLVIASETEKGIALKLQQVKKLTGNAVLKGRYMRQDYFEFHRTHKLVLVTNNLPLITEDSEATWRRILVIPFDVIIPSDERDPKLMEKLKAEWPGILAWLVRGHMSQLNGLRIPEMVKAASDEYRAASSSAHSFLDEMCVFGPDHATTTTDLRAAYTKWCCWHGVKAEHESALRRRLRAMGCEPCKVKGDRGWRGVSIRQDEDAEHGKDA
jgi:putative DNA primase/helicase